MSKKKIFIILNVFFLVFLIIFTFDIYVIYIKFADINLSINLNKCYQTMEGFGTSMAWNAQLFGNDKITTQNVANMLYGNNGMKLSIYRYNVGAGTKEIDNEYWYEERATESFFDSSKFVDINSFSDKNNYDFSKDQNAFNVFKSCVSTGNVKTLVLFANSPHYLMAKNGKGNADEGDKSNLPQENYAVFADYLLIIAQHFYDFLHDMAQDVKIYISPVNEPQWDWSGPDCGQEGCHFNPDELAKFYDVFYTKLVDYNAVHHTDFYPEFFESGSYVGDYKDYIAEFKKYDFYSKIDSLAFHSYVADNNTSPRKLFAKYKEKELKEKQIHMSEWCVMQNGIDKSVDMGLYSASVMLKDLTQLSATEWCWWLGASYGDYEDGLIYLSDEDSNLINTTYRYSMFAQFTRYISKGDTRVDVSIKDIFGIRGIESCAFKRTDGTIVVVLINTKDCLRKLKIPRNMKLEGGSFTDNSNKLTHLSLSEKIVLNPKSVTTLVLSSSNYCA